MPWLVIRFDETDEVEALPQSWYNEEEKIVYYPPFPRQQLQRSIRREISPNLDTWGTYKVSLMRDKPYTIYTEACRKATKACVMSDLSTSEDILPEKRISKKTQFSESERSDSDESLCNVPGNFFSLK